MARITMQEYLEKAKRTAVFEADPKTYLALKLASEAGEIAGLIAKELRGDNNPNLREDVLYELGDFFWYVAITADEFGYTLEDVAEANIAKLERRMANGTIRGSGSRR